jgi:hypothetical protein
MERSVIFAVGASVIALLIVLELVRRRKLREDYSLLWLATAGLMFMLAASRDLLHGLSAFLGIAYPPNLLFLMATLFVLLILLYFSVVITRLTHENREIAQQIALLRYQLEHTEHVGGGEQVQPEPQHAEHQQQ